MRRAAFLQLELYKQRCEDTLNNAAKIRFFFFPANVSPNTLETSASLLKIFVFLQPEIGIA